MLSGERHQFSLRRAISATVDRAGATRRGLGGKLASSRKLSTIPVGGCLIEKATCSILTQPLPSLGTVLTVAAFSAAGTDFRRRDLGAARNDGLKLRRRKFRPGAFR
jgi:hypothetical protein